MLALVLLYQFNSQQCKQFYNGLGLRKDVRSHTVVHKQTQMGLTADLGLTYNVI